MSLAPPLLISMTGLPGAGKSFVADVLALELGAFVLSVDPIEAAMWTAGISPEQPTGLAAYVVAEVVASEALRRGQTVIVDAVNPVEAARQQWRGLAEVIGCPLRVVEVICSDLDLHRSRIEARHRSIPGMNEVTWQQVQTQREVFEPLTSPRYVVDSADDIGATLPGLLDYCLDSPGKQTSQPPEGD